MKGLPGVMSMQRQEELWNNPNIGAWRKEAVLCDSWVGLVFGFTPDYFQQRHPSVGS